MSANLDPVNVIPYIDEVESAQVRPVLGAALYKQIDDGDYTDSILLNGGYYANNTKYCDGLKKAISYLTYARMLPGQQLTVTAYGAVTKTGEFSSKATGEELQREINHARQLGEQYLQSCVEYLKSNGLLADHVRARRLHKITAIG